jgi:hypothetical protein
VVASELIRGKDVMNSAKSLMTVGILSALALLAPGGSIAGAEQGAAPAKPAVPANRTDISKVDVEVKDFSFSARTPAEWREDAEAAKKYRVNLVFVPETEEAKANNAVIQVSADHKYDENISMVLDTQIANFRTRYPNLELGDLDVKHPSYATFPKLASQAGDFYQYMAYVNPGTLYPYVFYVSLTTKKTAATPAETAAFREVLESLQVNPPKGK